MRRKGVGYWSFDEGKGDIVKDISGNKNDGEIVGAEWVDGKFGKALKFNGDDAYIEIPSETIGTGEQLTIELWVKPFDQTEGKFRCHKDIIRSQCHGGGGFWGISTTDNFNSNNKFYIQIGWITGSDAWWRPAEATFTKDNWNYLVLVFDRTSEKSILYCNGKEFVEATHTVGKLPITTGFRMANDCAGAFCGIIDEVKIYNKILSAEEVKAAYSRK